MEYLPLGPAYEGGSDRDGAVSMKVERALHEVDKLRTTVAVASSGMNTDEDCSGNRGEFHQRRLQQKCVAASDLTLTEARAPISNDAPAHTQVCRDGGDS